MIKPKTWKHKGVFGPAEVHVGKDAVIGLNGVRYRGVQVTLGDDHGGPEWIDLITARWLVERLQHVIALVDAENAAVMVRE